MIVFKSFAAAALLLGAAAPVLAATVQPGDAAAGQVVFNGTCSHCHGPNAVVEDRRINLRRLHHKYGDDMDSVFLTTVNEGRPAKGMPTWKAVFSQKDFADILAYLKTIQE
jgi:polar amino acid transport system substrate-binding protein